MLQEAPKLDPDAKRRIANQHLSWMLKREKEFATPISFQTVKDRLFKGALPTFLPEDLMRNLGFEDLDWRHKVLGADLSNVFFGKKPSQEQDRQALINDAEATIEISARAIAHKFSNSAIDYCPDALFVRIAGIHQESGRIVAASYDAKTGQLTEANVSVSPMEMPLSMEYEENLRRKGIYNLIPSLDKPYSVAGLITEAMTEKVKHNNVITIKPHQEFSYSIAEQGIQLATERLSVVVFGEESLKLALRSPEKRSTIEIPTKLEMKP
ncbi:hypothetical protein M1146_03545 [Patescibacteria group bacterium]|nr:hypothetical protein [Patescibacteria group bacterium]